MAVELLSAHVGAMAIEDLWVNQVELYAEAGFGRKGSRGRSGSELSEWEGLQGVCPNVMYMFPDAHAGHSDRVAIIILADFASALTSVVRLWELRLQGVHQLTPVMCILPEKMDSILKPVFLAHINTLLDVQGKELLAQDQRLLIEIEETNAKLKKKFHTLENFRALKAVVKDLSFRREQILMKLAEFRKAMQCLATVITSLGSDDGVAQETPVFMLRSDWTWSQLHCIIQRECERLRVQLPLYARRSDIISQLKSNQVVVLVGETGSGKSTQLVQYLYDAGYAGDGKSVVCTQPRKVAANNLTQRVKEESDGCYGGPFPVGCVTASNTQSYARLADTNITTDFILLQFCLIDPLLSNFSCVVVDEAHERSLNTDLLLAMLKSALTKRPDLKVVIMSATADAELLSAYFRSGEVLRVPGRNFPVHVIYEAGERAEDWYDQYLNRAVKKVKDIHEKESEGNILAFLTAPAEVEWACSQFSDPSAVVLPLHGKLQHEDLRRVFQENVHGRRKIVFATNFAETSLTIPDVKYVVDCGLAKESTFDPKKGMNVLQVGKIDQSSAIQRAGRAGRTQSGVCYRLYGESEFEGFASHRLPEIRRVHLGVAILKLLALGIKEIENFDFVESPDPQAIQLALRVLDQLGAVKQDPRSGDRYLTGLGWNLVKLAIEPRLGKILLDSIHRGFGQDGLVIAALMSNSGSVFYRSGSDEVKERADRLKMRFCHPHGELFTLMSVYQEWESQPERSRNQWCLRNCISSKAMKRCQDQVMEMRNCLRYELKLNVPSTYKWSPAQPVEASTPLRKIIFAALAGNLAVHTGHDRLGYTVLSSGQQALLHPSSSILVFGMTPDFVVYGEILHTSNTFLDLVTVVEPEWIQPLSCSSLKYDVSSLRASIMRQWLVPMTSGNFLSRVSGKQGQNLMLLKQAIQEKYNERCMIDLSYENNTMIVYTTPKQMAVAQTLVQRLILREKRWSDNEALEKPLVTTASNFPTPTILVGAGAAIRDILMPGEFATVEIMYESSSGLDERDDEQLLELFDLCGEGLAGFDKHSRGSDKDQGPLKWGVVRFRSSGNARKAVKLLNGLCLSRGKIQLIARLPEGSSTNSFNRAPLPAVKATLAWARRKRKGWATVRCDPKDTLTVMEAVMSNPTRGGPYVHIKPDRSKENSLFLMGLDPNLDENILQETLFEISGCRILDCYMPRSPAPISQPSVKQVQEEIVSRISGFVPKDKFHVLVFEPKERDYIARAEIRFDESVHEGATSALGLLEGLVLPACKQWQAITCRRMFSSQVHMSRLMCGVLKQDLEELVTALQQKYADARINISSRESGAQRVQVSAPSLAVVAGCKCALEKLMEGQAIVGEDLDESAVRLLFTKRGSQISRAVEIQTKTLVLCDKRTQVARIYGPQEKKAIALKEIVSKLKKLHSVVKSRQIALRGEGMPPGLMREIVRTFGLDLQGLRSLAGGDVKLNIDHRSHLLSVNGGDMDAVVKVQAAVADMAQRLTVASSDARSTGDIVHQWRHGADECSICFCPMDDKYCLEACGHGFCRSCLIDQIKSAIRHRDGFPLTCAYDGCHQLFVLADITKLLTLEQQDELYKASLSAFVAQHPLTYRYCTTADCPNVYRVTRNGDRFACAACSLQICTACHVEYHEDLSCEEYERYKLDPDASLQAWREGKIDVKNCPSCGSVIEKVDGCNHMVCICGNHVCWVCLMTFVDSGPCYDHLRTAHDGSDFILIE